MTSTSLKENANASPKVGPVMDEKERAIVKAQRNLTLEWYTKSQNEMTEYHKIREDYLNEWRELMNKPQPFNQIQQYQQKVIESKAHLYETRLLGIVEKLNQWNQELSYKILEYNIMLGFEEDDLYSTHGDKDSEIHEWLKEVDSDEEDGEVPNFQEQLNKWATEERESSKQEEIRTGIIYKY